MKEDLNLLSGTELKPCQVNFAFVHIHKYVQYYAKVENFFSKK